ncbi:MAG: hypothetical protein ACI9MJ_001003 [Alphaproteobacteria bacterium]|jgi:hypothetical protein
MKTFIAIAVGSLLLTGCSLFGVRSGYEQPHYEVSDRIGENLEVRRYGPRLAAEVRFEASPKMEGRRAAFRLLFDYISGANSSAASIDMTAPVEMSEDSRKIAMTTPVETSSATDGQVSMRFFLPSNFTLRNAPQPSDPRVRILEISEQILVVLRFSGSREDAIVREKKEQLVRALEETSWQVASEPVAYFYDPPWTLPFLRRNEVAVAVTLQGS